MSNFGIKNLLKDGLGLMRRNWRQMAVYTLIIWILDVVLLGPPTSWILTKLGSSGSDVIVGNYGMANWLFSVQGIAYVLLAGALIPFSIILYIVGLFRIANASINQTALTIRESMAHVLIAIPRLLRFSLYVFGVCLVIALCIGAGLGVVYLSLLTSHDINYYKTNHPPQWYWALALGGVWALCVLVPSVYFALRNAFILPIWMEGDQTVRQAFRTSWEKTQGKIKPLAGVFGLFLAIWLLAGIVLSGVLFAIAGFVLTHLTFSFNGIIFVVSAHLLASIAMDTVLNFIGMAWYICIWVVFYRHVMGLNSVQKPAADASSKPLNITTELLNFLRPRVIFPIVAILLIISAGLSVWMLRDVPDQMPAPLVIAHRAGAAGAPENTLAALEKAIRDGATDFVEIDVQLTLDDVIVVAHDTDLMKVANDPRQIRKTNYAELSQIDIGKQFAPEFAGQRLSKLSDFLEAGKGKAKFIIEFKQSKGTDLIKRTLSVVNQYGMADQVVFMSLDLNDIRQAQQLTSDIPIGYLVVTEVGNIAQLDVAFVAVQEKGVTPRMLRGIRSKNKMAIYAWTVNDSRRMLELIEMGIDGLITDKPVRVAEISEKYQTLNPIERSLLTYRRFWDVFREMGLWQQQSPESVEEM
ncbi:MAG: glycerophosphodiester phosphodiesterase family protein [Planctomycetota bacterium]|jgi:glycerophosphoryl diester phosphodiesterase